MAKILILVLLNFLFYIPSLQFFFVSDDFYFLSINSFSQAINFRPDFYHYNPIFWSLIWIVKSIFGLNPFAFHSVTLLVHILNVIAGYYLGKLLLRNNKLAFLSALLFSFFFSHYEVVYWVTGLNTSLMVLFYLSAFIVFTRLTNQITIFRYSTFLGLFILALLSHEYALTLLITCFSYYLLFTKNKNKLLDSIKIFSLPVFILILTLIIKLQQSNVNLIIKIPTFTRFFTSIIKSFLYLFIPNPFFIDSLPKVLIIILGILLITLLILRSYKSRLNIFLFSWLFFTIILFSATSLPQARYFYLSSIPAIFLIISSMQNYVISNRHSGDPDAKSGDSRIRFWTCLAGRQASQNNKITLIYSIFVILSGIIFLKYQERLWTKSSSITQNIIKTLNADLTGKNIKQPIYIIDLLDSVNGPPWQAYVFRNGLEDAIFIYTGRKVKINYLRTVGVGGRVRNDPETTWDDIHILLDKRETVYQYDNGPNTISRLKKL